MAPTVCIDVRYIRKRPSGVSTIVQALVDYIPGLAPDLQFLFLKHPEAPARLSTAPNVREVVLAAEANGPATLFYLPFAAPAVRHVDLYHGPFSILPHWLTMRTVVTINDVMWLRHPRWAMVPGWWGYVEVAFYHHGIHRTLDRATRIIAISEATKSEIGLVDRAAMDRTRVVLEGVSEEFNPHEGEEALANRDRVREKYLPGAKRYVLTVGQFSVYKNHETVLRAFARAFRDEPDVHLGFVQRLGKGPKYLGPIARRLGVESRVHFLHGVPFPDLVTLYNGAMVYCHPSLYEGFGNGPAEAMAAGCPVVTSNRSSMPEVSGVAALLVDPESIESVAAALRRVAHEPGLAASMRERGLRRAKELSWKTCAEGTLAVYRETLEI